MEKPKIAILGVKYYPSRGGVSRVVEDTLIQLKHQFDFTIYCYEHPEAKDNIEGVETIQFPKPPFAGLGVFIYYLRCAFHLRKHGKFDLVHIHKTDAAFILPLLSKRFKCIATSHEAPYKRDKWSALGKYFFRKMEKTFIRSHAKLTSISKPLSDYYFETYHRDVQFIPNGVDLSVEPDGAAADEVLSKFGINGPFVFFAARRIMGTKGCHHMLKALKRINYSGDIVIAGDTDQLPAYTKELKQLSKGLNVHFIGYISSKAQLMALVQKAHIFCFPSETEGMSIMLLEVGSIGTPLIASDIPENTAVFNSEDLLFFSNKDHLDLAEKFKWALDNYEAMNEKAEVARDKVHTHYSREVVALHYARLYTDQAKIPSPVS
ncbi:MAG: glycosyltransferase family 4 protein [Bacteroidota bacterium]